jgi:predicted nucleic acid-binding protein
MVGFLLDTNVVSELRKQRPNSGLLRWIEVVDEVGSIFGGWFQS